MCPPVHLLGGSGRIMMIRVIMREVVIMVMIRRMMVSSAHLSTYWAGVAHQRVGSFQLLDGPDAITIALNCIVLHCNA